MDEAEFDQFADEYLAIHSRNITASGESPEFFAAYKIADVAGEARARGLRVERILDFGSGPGNSVPHFAARFPDAALSCADVSRRSLEMGRRRFPHIRWLDVEIQADYLPLEDESFDLSFSACVFHHIPPEEHLLWLSELRRVTRRGGILVIFEHNPFNFLTVEAVRTCPFDANARLIRAGRLRRLAAAAGWADLRVVFRIFFPHMLAFARPVERYLRWCPLGAQYFLIARRPTA